MRSVIYTHNPVADIDITFRGVGSGGGGNEMRLNAKGTVENFEQRKLIYNKIITRPSPIRPASVIVIHG